MKIWNTLQKDFEMITSETPHKLAEIIRATWPNLYNSPKNNTNDTINKIKVGKD